MFLNTHSFFSFRYGVMSPRALLEEAQKLQVKRFALTDINSTSGCLSFVRLAREYGVKPILGVDFRNGIEQQFVAIARNNEGFQEINDYLSYFLHEKKPIPNKAPAFENVFVIYPFESKKIYELKEREYIGVNPADVLKMPFSQAKELTHAMVMMPSVSFRHQLDFNIHRLLRAIDKNTLLSKLSTTEQGELRDQFYNERTLIKEFNNTPVVVKNTQYILANSDISFEFGNEYPHKNIKTYNQTPDQDYHHIRRLCMEGITYRYKKPGFKIYRRLALELDVIHQKGFVSYFLVNWDILKYARQKGYFYVGRGSGANSIVAYLLRITDVDPVELDLYFERFINLYRANPPDFDIDFSWKDREDITRYIFERFGYDKVALLATYNTFKFRAVIRELGKVFGLPAHEIDKIPEESHNSKEPITRLILKYAKRMDEIPSHLSIHAGGIIISEKPIRYYTATSLPPKGFPVTHFDMVVAEDVGLYKFDILSQRGLEKIKDTLVIIRDNHPTHQVIDIHDTKRFFEDQKVKELLRYGKAIGCFYVESPAMRMLLKKLKADHYLGLVAASSVIRPGVAKSGMMRQYILRFRKPEKRKEAHPILADLMPETFGVMVYQEDVIKVAHYFAGLTLGEADMLRRGMSGKFRSRDEFLKVKKKFFDNCLEMGHDEALTYDVWRQVESFAGYAFAKGHSASYAIESYQSLFLKAYYPLEYMVAVINNGGGFYSRELYIHEARMHGGIIEAPCINTSQLETIIRGHHIYLGFHMIKELEIRVIKQILGKRDGLGTYASLEQFLEEVTVGIEQLKILIRIGAFRSIEANKKELLWRSHFLMYKRVHPTHMYNLFEPRNKKLVLPNLSYDSREDAFDELEILNFPLKSPFELVQSRPPLHIIHAKEMRKHQGKTVSMFGYLVTTKRTSTNKGNHMYFGTFLDEEGLFIDTVHFPPVSKKYPFRGKGIYELTGKVVEEFEFYTLEIISMVRSNYVNMEDVDNEISISQEI